MDYHVAFPVAVDSDLAIWRAFNNQYWPAFSFIDAQGRVRYHCFGEGQYDKAERVIQQLLAEAGRTGVPAGSVSPMGEGVEAAPGPTPARSQESYLGYARAEGFASPGGAVRDRAHAYQGTSSIRARRPTCSRSADDGWPGDAVISFIACADRSVASASPSCVLESKGRRASTHPSPDSLPSMPIQTCGVSMIDTKLEVVVVPVADVDCSKRSDAGDRDGNGLMLQEVTARRARRRPGLALATLTAPAQEAEQRDGAPDATASRHHRSARHAATIPARVRGRETETVTADASLSVDSSIR